MVSDAISNLKAGVGLFFWTLAHFGYKTDWLRFDDEALPLSAGTYTPEGGAVWREPKLPQRNVPKPRYAITGWRPATTHTVAHRYNGGGDGNYFGKLEYCYALIRGSIAGIPAVRNQ